MAKVSNKFLAEMPAHTIKGNNSGSSANPSNLTATQVTAELNNFVGDSGSGGTKGMVPAPVTGDATKFLKGDGTWATATFTAPSSEVFVTGGNGYGSTNTKIRRFVTTVKNTGSDITYTDSSINGGSFTINTTGIYAISYNDGAISSESNLGVSLNSTQLTTNIDSITNANRVTNVVDYLNRWSFCGSTLHLNSGDVIRAHTDGLPDRTGDAEVAFRITRIA